MSSPKKARSEQQRNSMEMENSSNGSYGSLNGRNIDKMQNKDDDSEKQNISKKIVKRMSSSDLSTESGLNVSSTNSDEIVDFDDLIHHFGDCGRYQMLLFVLMVPFICFIAFVFYSQFFITLVPEHYWCRVPELESLSVHER